MSSTERAELVAKVAEVRGLLKSWEAALAEFDARPENNVYENLDVAQVEVWAALETRAHADCEGSYNCGQVLYTQGFFVGHQEYIGTLRCEYNRHDKTYYYLEESDFSYEKVTR